LQNMKDIFEKGQLEVIRTMKRAKRDLNYANKMKNSQ
jgi:hypothetical protein